MMVSKEKAYERLVEAVQEDYRQRIINQLVGNKEGVYVQGCKYEGKRLNLWSYWQGSLEADILVVGQDWGCFASEEPDYKNTELDARMLENFKAMDEGNNDVLYFDGTESMKCSDTDENLQEYFKMLGEEFGDIKKKNKRLFFTNLCLGYRNKGFSGGFKRKWLKDDIKYFKNKIYKQDEDDVTCLLDILEPKYILCLGKEVYNTVREAFGEKLLSSREFYKQLDEGRNLFVGKFGTKDIKVFGLAHPGNMGTANRYTRSGEYQKGQTGKGEGRKLQLQDWKRVGEKITELN